MIEAGANEIPETADVGRDSWLVTQKSRRWLHLSTTSRAEIGKPKFEFQSMRTRPRPVRLAIEAMVGEQVKVALDTDDKNVRDARMQPIIDAVHEKYDPRSIRIQGAMLDECLYKLQKIDRPELAAR